MGISKEQEVQVTWKGRAIRVAYIPDFCKIVGMAHIQVFCDEVLPITETGYKSYFIHRVTVEEYGGVIDFVAQWLEHEAQNLSWTRSEAGSLQLSLF